MTSCAPEGALYLVEIHPMALAVVEDGLTITRDTLDAEYREWDGGDGTYAEPDAVLEHTLTYERDDAPASDVLTAVLEAGFVVELFHETQSYSAVPWPWTERGDDGYYRRCCRG